VAVHYFNYAAYTRMFVYNPSTTQNEWVYLGLNPGWLALSKEARALLFTGNNTSMTIGTTTYLKGYVFEIEWGYSEATGDDTYWDEAGSSDYCLANFVRLYKCALANCFYEARIAGTRTMGNYFMYNCPAYTTLDLKSAMWWLSSIDQFNIGNYFMGGCTGLTTIIWPDNMHTMLASYFGTDFLGGCTGLKTLNFPTTLNVYFGTHFLRGCSGLTSIHMGNIRYNYIEADQSFRITYPTDTTKTCSVKVPTSTGTVANWNDRFTGKSDGVEFILP
jgi:hypothetical protein